MRITRRTFVQTSAAAGAAVLTATDAEAQGRGGSPQPPASILALKPPPNPAPPITDDERRGRVAKAQRLMERYRLTLPDLFHSPEKLRETLAVRTLPSDLQERFTEAKAALERLAE